MERSCANCQFHNKREHSCKFGFNYKHIDPDEAKYECCTEWHEENDNYEAHPELKPANFDRDYEQDEADDNDIEQDLRERNKWI